MKMRTFFSFLTGGALLAFAGQASAAGWSQVPGSVNELANYGISMNGNPNGNSSAQFCGQWNTGAPYDVVCLDLANNTTYSMNFAAQTGQNAQAATVTAHGYWAVDYENGFWQGTSSVAINFMNAYQMPSLINWQMKATLPNGYKQMVSDGYGTVYVLGADSVVYAYNESTATFAAADGTPYWPQGTSGFTQIGWSPSLGWLIGLDMYGQAYALFLGSCVPEQGCTYSQWVGIGGGPDATCSALVTSSNVGTYQWNNACVAGQGGAFAVYWGGAPPTYGLHFGQYSVTGPDTDYGILSSVQQYQDGIGWEWPGPGDTDCAPQYNPMTGQYDQVPASQCVAGYPLSEVQMDPGITNPIQSIIEGPFQNTSWLAIFKMQSGENFVLTP